jgi:hypothetical protein
VTIINGTTKYTKVDVIIM